MGENKNEQIKYLIKELNRLTELYDLGTPEVSDKIWDNMYFELVQLENETNIYYKDSPTQKINYEIKNQLNKIEHSHPMLSLDKTKNIDDLIDFMGMKGCLLMAKMDGLTCSLTYKNGRLVSAETRGNGIIGEDILHNALVVKNIPNKINCKESLVVDGEIICDYHSFKEFENEYKNPRNFASGSIRLLDSRECEKRKLSFIAWDMVVGYENDDCLSTRLLTLKDLGFTIVPNMLTTKGTIDYDIDIIKEQSKDLGYPIDGCVIKYNMVSAYLAAGKTDHHFKGRNGV